MKTLYIATALLLVAATSSIVHAETDPEAAFGPHFGLTYVYDIVNSAAKEATKMMTKHKKDHKVKTNYFARVGTNGIGTHGTPVQSDGSSGMDGPFPLIDIFDDKGTLIARTTGSKSPYLDSGEFKRTNSKVVFPGTPHYRMKVTAGDDGAPSPNAACISSIAVSPDEKSGSPTYALSAELVLSVDNSVPWYYSGQQSYAHIPSNDCRPVRIPGVCFWLSQFVKKDYTPVYSVEVSNIPEYIDLLAAPEAKLPSPESVKIIRSVRQETPKPDPALAPAPAEAAATVPTKRDDDDQRSASFKYANIGTESAQALCDCKRSYGPNYLSKTENMYCDLSTHKLFHECKSDSETNCYRVVNNAVSTAPKPHQIGDKDFAEFVATFGLSLREFGLNSETVNIETALKKRAECVKGSAKAALSIGETLTATDYVASEEGGPYRLVVLGSTGDVIVYDATSGSAEPSSIAIWKLGANGSRDSSYVVEVNANGQICSRASAVGGAVLKCTGPISAAGPAYQLTVSKMGAVYIKDGATVVWTTDPRVGTTPNKIAGTALTETNSFQSLTTTTGPKTFTSTNGKTTLEFKDGQLCLYNSLKVQTWCLLPPKGDSPDIWFTLTSRGLVCILRSTGGPLSSSCDGNQGDETGYVAVVHDDGFLKIYNSAEELAWQRGEAQTMSATSTPPGGV